MTRDGRKAVLVIDDDADFRSMVELFAEFCDVPVLQATDCAAGIKVVNREGHRIKLILLDYLMPGMTPVQCATSLIAAAGPSIAIVLVTAGANPQAKAAELRLDRWFSKPIEPSILTSLLTRD
jgi:CheY-like chemotaxis protein